MKIRLRHAAGSMVLAGCILVGIHAWKEPTPEKSSPRPPQPRAESFPFPDDQPRASGIMGAEADAATDGQKSIRVSKSALLPAGGRLPGEPLQPPPMPENIPVPAAPETGWAHAEIQIAGQRFEPGNIFGQIQPVRVAPRTDIAITVQWPHVRPGTSVCVEVVNSGRLASGALSQLCRADQAGQIHFDYTANDQPGTCLVVTRIGFEETTFTFEVEKPAQPDSISTPVSAVGEGV